MALYRGALRGSSYRPRGAAPVCVRCEGTERVIDDDGVAVCMVCVLAWGSYAGLVASDESEPEVAVRAEPHRDPTVTALLHWSHRVPVADCPLCTARR